MTDPTPGLLDEAAETTTHTEPVDHDCDVGCWVCHLPAGHCCEHCASHKAP